MGVFDHVWVVGSFKGKAPLEPVAEGKLAVQWGGRVGVAASVVPGRGGWDWG